MTYFVADDYDWHEHPTWSAAVEHALQLEREGASTEPVNVFEQVDWRCALLPHERKTVA